MPRWKFFSAERLTDAQVRARVRVRVRVSVSVRVTTRVRVRVLTLTLTDAPAGSRPALSRRSRGAPRVLRVRVWLGIRLANPCPSPSPHSDPNQVRHAWDAPGAYPVSRPLPQARLGLGLGLG